MTKDFKRFFLTFIMMSFWSIPTLACVFCDTVTATTTVTDELAPRVQSAMNFSLAPLAILLPFLSVYVAVFVLDFRWDKFKKEKE